MGAHLFVAQLAEAYRKVVLYSTMVKLVSAPFRELVYLYLSPLSAKIKEEVKDPVLAKFERVLAAISAFQDQPIY